MAVIKLEEIKEQVRRDGGNPEDVQSIKVLHSLMQGEYKCIYVESRLTIDPDYPHTHKILRAVKIKSKDKKYNGLALMMNSTRYTKDMLFKKCYYVFGCNPKQVVLPPKEIRSGKQEG